jgi:cytochrome c553
MSASFTRLNCGRKINLKNQEPKSKIVFSGIGFLVLGVGIGILPSRGDDSKDKSSKVQETKNSKSEIRNPKLEHSPSVFGFLAQGADAPRSGSETVGADHAAKMARGLEVFKKHVRPILVKSCVRCHGGKKTEGELDLTEREGLLHGGGRGPAILAGNAKDSLLYRLLTHARDPHMPRAGGKLSDEAVAQIALWIDLGAPYDKPLVAKNKVDDKAWTRKIVSDEDRQFWSFQPLRRSDNAKKLATDETRNQHGNDSVFDPCSIRGRNAWCRTPIDRFILAKMDAAGVAPNPPVDKERLIRRVYFDLLGLPPPPEEVRAFINDPAPDAYERLVDRLLASQHFGERWARHWLDLARFAESHGFEHDYDRPSAYHYRDFVIQAFNLDMSYDMFVQWQLAGDEFAPNNNLALTATGFLAAGVHSTQITKNEVEKHRYDEMDDMLATIGTSMLGLTFGCARCHDHKFDPIPQADYYRMLSTFTTTVRSEIDLDLDPAWYQKAKAEFDKEHAPYAAALKKYETETLPSRRLALEKAWESTPERFGWIELDALQAHGRPSVGLAALVRWSRTSDPEWRKLYQQVQDHLRKAPKPKTVKALVSSEGLPALRLHTQGDDFFPESYFLRRGDPNQKEGVAQQGFLQVLMTASSVSDSSVARDSVADTASDTAAERRPTLTGAEKRWQQPPPQGWRTSYRRRAFAEWITDTHKGAGQLLARVIVNRLWQHHLGRGIVATPSDFGSRGEPPTHPELLDWLASELIRNGWRLKPIHKMIVTSSVYMQSSRWDEVKARVDPGNHLFWRRLPHRLEAEVLRDALLAVSGTLDNRMYGPGTLEPVSRRRSIYFTVKRSKLMPMMQVFDAPEALGGVAQRPTTTIAPQALLLMNNPNVRSDAKVFAQRIAGDATTPPEDMVRSAYMIALSRAPAAEELADGVAFIKQQADSYLSAGKSDSRKLALADFCQTLMCLNEFVYVE